MYARVTVLEWKMGQKHEGMEEMIQLLHDRIVPTAKQQQGFKGFLGLLDRRGGKAMAITLWEMETDLRASEASCYYRAQLAELAPLSDLYTTPPYREVYEVVVQE
jgi:hypothetical protein